MKQAAIVALAVAAALTLTGCESWEEEELRLGITCHEAGGTWAQKEQSTVFACSFPTPHRGENRGDD